MNLKQLKNILTGLVESELEQIAVVQDEEGNHYVIKETVTKTEKMYYNRRELGGKCYTAKQMNQMQVPEKDWEFDFERKAVIFKIEEL